MIISWHAQEKQKQSPLQDHAKLTFVKAMFMYIDVLTEKSQPGKCFGIKLQGQILDEI